MSTITSIYRQGSQWMDDYEYLYYSDNNEYGSNGVMQMLLKDCETLKCSYVDHILIN